MTPPYVLAGGTTSAGIGVSASTSPSARRSRAARERRSWRRQHCRGRYPLPSVGQPRDSETKQYSDDCGDTEAQRWAWPDDVGSAGTVDHGEGHAGRAQLRLTTETMTQSVDDSVCRTLNNSRGATAGVELDDRRVREDANRDAGQRSATQLGLRRSEGLLCAEQCRVQRRKCVDLAEEGWVRARKLQSLSGLVNRFLDDDVGRYRPHDGGNRCQRHHAVAPHGAYEVEQVDHPRVFRDGRRSFDIVEELAIYGLDLTVTHCR